MNFSSSIGYDPFRYRNRVAIYARLSDDDGKVGQSQSITNQKIRLEKYVKAQEWNIYDIYIDDGYSGTNFDRPGFKRMINDIENGKIDIVITTDLSRLGREHIRTGEYIEFYFPTHNIRYVAMDEGVDTGSRYAWGNDSISYKNLNNENHARDTSKKVRKTFELKSEMGEYFTGATPYGYIREAQGVNKLKIDKEPAQIIIEIFDMLSKGYGLSKIAKRLRKERILTPSNYKKYKMLKDILGELPPKAYDWHVTSVKVIAENPVYIGKITNGKSYFQSYKVKKKIKIPKEEWIVMENMHPAIITEDIWESAQESLKSRKSHFPKNEKHIFSGLIKCADCGYALTRVPERNESVFFQCKTYKDKGKEACPSHRIKYDDLYDIVLKDINNQLKICNSKEETILNRLAEESNKGEKTRIEQGEKDLKRYEKRNEEINEIVKQLYEDRIRNSSSMQSFNILIDGYLKEQNQNISKMDIIREDIGKIDQNISNQAKWKKTLQKYTKIDELEAELLNKLIDKILVGEKKKVNGKYHQNVTICYKFVGVLRDN